MIDQKTKVERYRVVIGLSAAGMTYDEMARYVGVGTRQRVQQLVLTAVAKLPLLAERLKVTGRRQPGRRSEEDHEAQGPRKNGSTKLTAPRGPVRTQHIDTARELLKHNGGNYPGATEMMRLGHGSLYQFMRKYPHDFEHLKAERSSIAGQRNRKPKRRRRF